jgi:hypothetical protein
MIAGFTLPCQIDAGNAIRNVDLAIAGKPVIDADPAIGIALGGARAFEVFIQNVPMMLFVRAQRTPATSNGGRLLARR